jgi:hypothetical protein
MTEENDLRVSYDEVTRLSLGCKCGTELVFNLNLPEYKDGKWDWQRKQLSAQFVAILLIALF